VDPDVDRDRLVEHLNRSGVEAKAYFDPAIHQQPPYAGRDGTAQRALPVTEEASARTLIVPFFSTMTSEQVDRVAGALATGLAEQGRPA
jgi:perosamine synthetase